MSAATTIPLLAGEVLWRGSARITRRVTTARDRRTGPRPPAPGRRPEAFLRPAQGEPSPRPSQADLEACLEESIAAVGGRIRVLGHGLVDFGESPRWRSDPTSGAEWALVHHSQIRPLPGQADIKVPWEASRMLWLVALARAWRYTADDRFRLGALELLDSWTSGNPAGWGPNWSNAMEVGIRAVNLVWAAEIFDDPVVGQRVGGMLGSHGRFILENLEYSPSLTSNHFLADLVGLLYVGGALRQSRAWRGWTGVAARWFQREVLKQFYDDGANFEASTGYHRLATELTFFGLLACARLGLAVRPAVTSRFASALDVLELIEKPDGRIPAIGDDDSGLVCGLRSGRHARDGRPIVGAGRQLLRAPGGRADVPDEFQEWAVGSTAVPRRRDGPAALPQAGLFVLTAGGLWCLVDCGDSGQRGNGGHAHSDMLSFVLVVGGREIVTDPGTLVYTRDPATRNLLRSTFVHSTVAVDGQSQHDVSGPLFSMGGDRKPVVESWAVQPGRQRLTVSHDGYGRLADGVEHRRVLELDAEGLLVTDQLDCRGRHAATVSFPVALGVCAAARGDGWVLRAGRVVVRLAQVDGPPMSLKPKRLMVSDLYGSAAPSIVLQAQVAVGGPTGWAFRFSPVDEGSP